MSLSREQVNDSIAVLEKFIISPPEGWFTDRAHGLTQTIGSQQAYMEAVQLELDRLRRMQQHA